ncbi:MAG TPA: FtsX-like permease family protein, partial [Chitinophagaceae bacterium]|nr:FtsX-like permease family protein [Chitinophagaceae bacterium]
LPLPDAFKIDFPRTKVATIFGGSNNQIDVLDEKGNEKGKRFKEEDGVFYASASFFQVFNFKWLYGNPSLILTKPNTAALTKEVAEKYYGSWQNAIGKIIKKDNNELLRINGILENPPVNTDFQLKIVISYPSLESTDYFKRAGTDWGSISSRSQCYILLPQNLSAAKMNAQLLAFRKKYLHDDNTDYYVLQPLNDIHFNANYGNFSQRTISKETLLSLSLIGIFLLVLGCINFINLATAQAVKRSREVGIRKVLGSQRWQLALQFLGETFCIVLIAAILAIALVTILSPLGSKILDRPISLLPLQSSFVMMFIAVITIVVTFLSGLYPALVISGFQPMQALKNKIESRVIGGISLRRFLVTAQFVIAQVLIISTIIVVSQMNFFNNASLGFDKDAVLTLELPRDSISQTKWSSFKQQLLQQPGVERVSFSYTPPAGRSTHSTSLRFNQNVKDEDFELNLKLADADFLKTYNLQLIAGRFYEPSDTIREFVVNETFLKKEGIHDPKNAIGKYIIIDDKKAPVVGVVKDFHTSSLRDPIDAVGITTFKANYRVAAIKFDSQSAISSLQNIEKIFNSDFPAYIFEHQFLDETIARFYDQEERLSNVFKIFAAIGIFISCIGLYGLIFFMSVQRVKEVGVRKVLGASVISIVMLFFKEFLWLMGVAFIIASSASWYFMNQWLQNYAYRINISWWMFVVAAVLALIIVFISVSYQSIKSALTNPVKSLRTE